MCSECADYHCEYCFAEECDGNCGDPEKCPSCWLLESSPLALSAPFEPLPFFDVDDSIFFAQEDCKELLCTCECHVHMAAKDDPDLPRLTNDPFPFLSLPGELRNKIYVHVLRNNGNKRRSPYHRGTLDLALLSTCKQINSETRAMVLESDLLDFETPFAAYRFLTVIATPEQRTMIRSVQLDVQAPSQLFDEIFAELCDELGCLPNLRHLSLTIKGHMHEQWLDPNSTAAMRLTAIRGLETFNLTIAYADMPSKIKQRLVSRIHAKMLSKAMSKRKFEHTRGPAAKKRLKPYGLHLPVLAEPEDAPPPETFEPLTSGPPMDKPPKGKALQKLRKRTLERYDQLAEYAKTFSDGKSVSIRLAMAHDAADAGDEARFTLVAQNVLSTLEKELADSLKAREKLSFKMPCLGVDSS